MVRKTVGILPIVYLYIFYKYFAMNLTLCFFAVA